MKAAISRLVGMIVLPGRSVDNRRAGDSETLIVSPRRTTSENPLQPQPASGSKVSPKSSGDRGRAFVTGRCGCHYHGMTSGLLGLEFSIASTAQAKKEKRSKKERNATTTEFILCYPSVSLIPIRGWG